jgi:ketosteroid isomerase-like protein
LSTTPPSHSAPSRSWRAIAIVIGIVVVGGGIAFFLLKGGGDGDPGDHIVDPSHLDSPIPTGTDATPVHLSLKSTAAVPTVAKTKADRKAVGDAAKEIRDTLANMYTVAFTTPSLWDGDYEPVFVFFAPGKAEKAAHGDLAVLTLGPSAGDTFDEVTPKFSGVKVKVLTDGDGKPFTAAATVDFSADGKKKDGTTSRIKSHATYYLQQGDGGWVIVAYRAKRLDDGKAGPSGDGGEVSGPSATSGASQ